MIDLLSEGFESALLPCSLIILIPGVATAFAARKESTPALTGFVVSCIIMSWLRFSGNGGDFDRPIVAAAFAGSAVLLLVPVIRRLDILGVLGGLGAGAASATLWQPCVGEEFGSVLNELPTRGLIGFVLMAMYTAAVLAPVVALGAAMHVVPTTIWLPLRPAMMIIGGATLGLLAATTMLGLDDNLVGQLVSWSA